MNIIPLANIEEKKANFCLSNFLPIPENAVTLLSALGGTGKTRLSLIMADRYVKEKKRRATLWLTEDYQGQVRHTFNVMCSYGLTSPESMNMIDLILDSPPQLAKRLNGIFKANNEEINRIGEFLIKNNTGFAVFDPLLAFYGGNENDNSEARVFIQGFADWAKVSNVTTVIIHHANKEGGSRGATAFHDGVRCRYELDIPRYTNKDEAKIEGKEVGDRIESDYRNGFRIAKLKKDNWGVRMDLWKLTNNEDEIKIQIMPPIEAKHTEHTVDNPKIDNDFVKAMQW